MSKDRMREEFDLWIEQRGMCTMKDGETYYHHATHAAWQAWKASRAADAAQEETLADQMRAAGMMTVDEVMNTAPHDGFIRHAGVHDLDSYGQWLDMKCRHFLTMQAKRELNKDPEDDMYEWVIAHAAAFQVARINFNTARHAKTEQQPAPGVSALVEALEQVIKAAPNGGPLWHGSEQIIEARTALAAYHKGEES